MDTTTKQKQKRTVKSSRSIVHEVDNRYQEIQKIAYNLYKLRDSGVGNDLDDWLTAESFYEQLRNIR